MITLKMIHDELEEIKRKQQTDSARLTQVYEEINKKTAELQIANIDGDIEKVKKLSKELVKLQEEKDVCKSLAWASEHGHIEAAVLQKSKLGRMCKEFETQQIDLADRVYGMKAAQIDKLRAARRTFLETIRELHGIDIATHRICGDLESVRQFIPNPAIGYQEAYRNKYHPTDYGNIDIVHITKSAWGCPALPNIEGELDNTAYNEVSNKKFEAAANPVPTTITVTTKEA